MAADVALFDYLHKKHSPEFNEDVVNGIACIDVPLAKQYIDNIIRCGESQYPEGFEYVGSVRCTPSEEINVIARPRSGGNRIYDIAKNSTYLVRYMFKYNGQPLQDQYLYLPFVGQGGMLHVAGKQFMVAPVMGDIAFEVDENSVFIRIPRAPISFNRDNYICVIDDVRTSDTIVHSLLHNKGGKKSTNRSDLIRLGSVHTTMAHYLFCKYGLEGAFKKYVGASPVVIRQEEYNVRKYPKADWVKVSSLRKAPDHINQRRQYDAIATDVVLLVPRSHWTPMAKSFAMAFYYVIDHFPDYVEDHTELMGSWRWCVFLAFILWGEGNKYGKLVEDVENHLNTLDGYVDQETIRTLDEVNVHCEDLYDLMAHIIVEMDGMLERNRGHEACLYGKRLEVLRYLLRDINNSMFTFLFKITSNSRKNMEAADYENILRKFFKPWLIHGISSAAEHPEVSSVSNPSDNQFFKVTSTIVQQNDTHGRGKSQDGKPLTPSTYLDASFAAVTGFGVLIKSNPVGNNRFNPCVKLGPYHTTQEPEKFKELLAGVQRLIQRT